MSIEQAKMTSIEKTYVVMSGKGGVGKSTVAANLATSLALAGNKVGLLDVDIHGPSIPTMFGLNSKQLEEVDGKIIPITLPELNDLKVMSIGFLLKSDDSPVIWRGPMKNGVIKQFLEDVEWGSLDYLIIDCPPGTGDEPLSVIQLVSSEKSAIIVTTPQEVAVIDVGKSVNFCVQLHLPIAGIIENMSGFACPHCNEVSYIFNKDGGKHLASKYEVPFLGALPIDPSVGIAGDEGLPYVAKYKESPITAVYKNIIGELV